MEILENLDKSILETGNLKPILDTPDEPDRTDLDADIFQQAAYEGLKKRGGEGAASTGRTIKENSEEPTWPGLRVPEKIFPEVVIVLLFCKLNGLNDDE